jgi:superoxide reductase
MKRRDSIRDSALFAGALVAGNAFAQQGGDARFGDVIIPPEDEMDQEKHVPIIDSPTRVMEGEPFMVTVTVGKVVKHPNTVQHHIEWIQLFAKEEGSKYVVEIAKVNLGPTYASPEITVQVMLKKNSTLFALEYCNIHGVWDYSVQVTVS